jgi:hypothetical protein
MTLILHAILAEIHAESHSERYAMLRQVRLVESPFGLDCDCSVLGSQGRASSVSGMLSIKR